MTASGVAVSTQAPQKTQNCPGYQPIPRIPTWVVWLMLLLTGFYSGLMWVARNSKLLVWCGGVHAGALLNEFLDITHICYSWTQISSLLSSLVALIQLSLKSSCLWRLQSFCPHTDRCVEPLDLGETVLVSFQCLFCFELFVVFRYSCGCF